MTHVSRHILLVEDTDSVRTVLARQMATMGVEVQSAPGGDIALNMARATTFDLVLTDLRMPDVDGWAVIHGIRAIKGYEHTPIVLMTADPINLDQLPDAACAYVQKPISIEALAAIIEGRLQDQPRAVYDAESTAAINRDALREQMGELNEDAISMIKQFPQMMHPLLQQIRDQSETLSYKIVEERAHSLKGAALSVGAVYLAKICSVIQDQAASNSIDTEQIELLIREFARLEDEINTL